MSGIRSNSPSRDAASNAGQTQPLLGPAGPQQFARRRRRNAPPPPDIESGGPSGSGNRRTSPVSGDNASNNEFELGNYRKNLLILREIWNESGQRKSSLAELGKTEARDFAVVLLTTTVVTAAIYGISTTILSKSSKSPNGPDDDKIFTSEILNKFTSYLSAATAEAAGVGSSLVVTQAITGALTRMGKPIETLLKALLPPYKNDKKHEAQLKQNAFKELIVKLKPMFEALPEDRLGKLQFDLDDLKGDIDSLQGDNARIDYTRIKRIWDRVNLHLSYPSKIKDVYQFGKHGDKQVAQQIQQRQDELTKSFMNESVETKLGAVLTLARYSTINSEIPQAVVAFTGPPSVGKTWCANEAGEKVLDARVIKMNIDEFLVYTGVRKPDRSNVSWKDQDIDVIQEPHKGRIKDARYLNEVILIDEVKLADDGSGTNDLDKMEDLKKALTLKPEDYPEAFRLGIKPNNLRPLIILASNYELDKVKYKALASRFTAFIEFPDWTEEGYKERIKNQIDRLCVGMGELHLEPIVKKAGEALADLAPFVWEEFHKHKSTDPGKIYLREIHTALTDASVKCINLLDQSTDDDLDDTKKVAFAEMQKIVSDYFQDVATQYEKEKSSRPSDKASDAAENIQAPHETAEDMEKRLKDIINDLESKLADQMKSMEEHYIKELNSRLPSEAVGGVSTAISDDGEGQLRQRKPEEPRGD